VLGGTNQRFGELRHRGREDVHGVSAPIGEKVGGRNQRASFLLVLVLRGGGGGAVKKGGSGGTKGKGS